MSKIIASDDLVDMRQYDGKYPLKIDVVYAQANHPENIFGRAIYRKDAPLLLHKDLAAIVLNAAKILYTQHGWTSILMDGLRPIEAQEAMQETDIVKRNPHWCEQPNRLLSPPGKGGHPRGMAIDIVCEDASGARINMGTAFDHLSEDPDYNPAARTFKDLPKPVLKNRQILEKAVVKAAEDLQQAILPIPSEWWDFRFFPDHYNQYAPISDHELPEELKICTKN
jgi:D-alanyl-D-alanine dipeptidase